VADHLRRPLQIRRNDALRKKNAHDAMAPAEEPEPSLRRAPGTQRGADTALLSVNLLHFANHRSQQVTAASAGALNEISRFSTRPGSERHRLSYCGASKASATKQPESEGKEDATRNDGVHITEGGRWRDRQPLVNDVISCDSIAQFG
jgi:hypothetical protein